MSWECSLLFNFLEEQGWNWYYFFLECLVEFTREAIWAWNRHYSQPRVNMPHCFPNSFFQLVLSLASGSSLADQFSAGSLMGVEGYSIDLYFSLCASLFSSTVLSYKP